MLGFESILYPILSVGGLALLLGAVLGFSARKFAVETDPNVDKIFGALPGVNCGGCGFPGCAIFAERVAMGSANYNGCPPGGTAAAKEIAGVLGLDVAEANRKAAFVKCGGTNRNIKINYIYDGPKSCVAASQLATGGNKSCPYSCIGLESCRHACPFRAIKTVDGVSEIISEKCTACGICIDICPKNLIELAPDKAKVRVACNSRENGKTVRENCRAGCIGCGLCKKNCPEDAITVENNLARIDYEKCTLCMTCVQKCPPKTIILAD